MTDDAAGSDDLDSFDKFEVASPSGGNGQPLQDEISMLKFVTQ